MEGGSMLSPSLLSVSLRMSGLDLGEKGMSEFQVETMSKAPCHLGTLMGPGQFSTRGTALTNCWLPKKDQGDSLRRKSSGNQKV